MLSDDELAGMLRSSDPNPGGSATDPGSATAARIFARVRGRVRRRHRRILVLVPVVALTVAGVTAGTRAWVAGDGKGHTLDSTAVTCVSGDHSDAGFTFDSVSQDPVRICRQQWQEMFGRPAPGKLTACVDSSAQGSIKVYPGGRDQCGRHRADPYTGPTREQLGLAAFRSDIRARFDGRTCVTYPEFRHVVDRLLAEHGLTGWSSGHFQTAEKKPEGDCAEISYYDEPKRTIWLGDHEAGTPLTFL